MDRLDVVGTVRAAYRSILDHSRLFLTLAVPILILAIVAKQFLPAPGAMELGVADAVVAFAVLVVFIYLKLVLALAWHRAVLLRRRDPENLFGLTARFWRFFMYGLLYTIVVAIPGFVLGGVLMSEASMRVTPGDLMDAHPALFLWTGVAQVALTTLAVARFGFVFPAASIDRPIGLAAAWRDSSGCTGPIAAVVFCALAPFAVINHALGYVLQADIGAMTYHALFALSVVFDYVGFLVLIAAVSRAYAWRHDLRPDLLAQGASATQT